MGSQTEARSNRRRAPIFYGWVILLAGTIGSIMTSPGQTYTVSIFVDHFIRDLGLSRSAVSALYTAGTLGGSLTLPFWGRQIDRRGARVIVVAVAVLFGLACLYMASVRSALMLGLGFVAIRMLGQGSLSLVSQTVINHWWVRRRGMALGISSTVMAVVGMGLFPRLVFTLVDGYGWRTAYALMGAAVLAILTPVGYFLFRRQPEVYGLQPDGPAPAESKAERRPQPRRPAAELTLKEAMAGGAFWLLLCTLGLYSLVGTALMFHLVRIFEDSGLPAVVAAQTYAPMALASAAASLSGGLLSDRLPARFLLVAALLGLAATLLLILGLGGPASAYVFGAAFGLSGGLFQTLHMVVWPSFYGRKHLGSIAGFAAAATVVGAALGPLPFGLARDAVGTYLPALLASAGVAVVFAVANLLFVKPPKG